jgi:hypothetical protein
MVFILFHSSNFKCTARFCAEQIKELELKYADRIDRERNVTVLLTKTKYIIRQKNRKKTVILSVCNVKDVGE